MMLLSVFIPFLLVLVIVFVIVKMRGRNSRLRLFYGGTLYRLIISYAVVLLIATIVFSFLQHAQLSGKEDDLETMQVETTSGVYTLENAVLTKHEQFEFRGDTLTISPLNEEYIPARVIIDRKEEDGNTIDVMHYFERKIPMEHIEPYFFTLKGNELIIYGDSQVHLDYAAFMNEFPIRQFTGERLFGSNTFLDVFGDELIYIRVPQSIHIKLESMMDVQFTK